VGPVAARDCRFFTPILPVEVIRSSGKKGWRDFKGAFETMKQSKPLFITRK